MYPFITVFVTLVFIGSLLFVFRKWGIYAERIMKIMTVAFYLLGLSRLLLADGFPEIASAEAHPEYLLETLLRWGYNIGFAVIPMAIFTESKLFRNIATYFSSIMALLSMIFMDFTMEHFLNGTGCGFVLTPALRYILYILELALALSIPVLMSIHRKHILHVPTREELLHIALGLPAILLQMMPAYVPATLLGYTDIPNYGKMFAPFHLIWIALIVAECVVLFLYFRRRTSEDKHNLLLFLALAQVFHTMSIFLRGFTLHRMPIQLCSIAAFFYLFTIITRSRKIFDFCFLANIVGALIAIVLIAFDVGALQFFNIHYMYEHTFVVLMPVLALALGEFPRMERSSLRHALIVFSIYFLSCFVLGMIINGISKTGGYAVNYFYMFNLTVALEYLPFATFLGAVELPLGMLKVYPLLIVVIYMVFVLLISGFYAMMRGIYRLKDHFRPTVSEEAQPVAE